MDRGKCGVGENPPSARSGSFLYPVVSIGAARELDNLVRRVSSIPPARPQQRPREPFELSSLRPNAHRVRSELLRLPKGRTCDRLAIVRSPRTPAISASEGPRTLRPILALVEFRAWKRGMQVFS
jgi:hypothetical protein